MDFGCYTEGFGFHRLTGRVAVTGPLEKRSITRVGRHRVHVALTSALSRAQYVRAEPHGICAPAGSSNQNGPVRKPSRGLGEQGSAPASFSARKRTKLSPIRDRRRSFARVSASLRGLWCPRSPPERWPCPVKSEIMQGSLCCWRLWCR